MLSDSSASLAHIDNEWAALSAAINDPADAAEKLDQALVEATAALQSYVTLKRLNPRTPEPNWHLACHLLNTTEELFRTY